MGLFRRKRTNWLKSLEKHISDNPDNSPRFGPYRPEPAKLVIVGEPGTSGGTVIYPQMSLN